MRVRPAQSIDVPTKDKDFAAQTYIVKTLLRILCVDDLDSDAIACIETKLDATMRGFLLYIAFSLNRSATVTSIVKTAFDAQFINQWIAGEPIEASFKQLIDDTTVQVADPYALPFPFRGSGLMAITLSKKIPSCTLFDNETPNNPQVQYLGSFSDDTQQAINRKLAAIDQEIESVRTFAKLISSDDLSSASEWITRYKDTPFSEYFVAWAASQHQAKALKTLTEAGYPLSGVTAWLTEWLTDKDIVGKLPKYFKPHLILAPIEDSLIHAVRSNNKSILSAIKDELCRHLPAKIKFKMNHAAICQDNVEMLAFLLDTLRFPLQPAHYDWEKEHTYIVSKERTVYVLDHPAVEEEKTAVRPAKDDLYYENALLAAANSEKVATLACLFKRRFTNFASLLKRCDDMATTRPTLAAFLARRKSAFIRGTVTHDAVEESHYIQSIKNDDEHLNMLIDICAAGNRRMGAEFEHYLYGEFPGYLIARIGLRLSGQADASVDRLLGLKNIAFYVTDRLHRVISCVQTLLVIFANYETNQSVSLLNTYLEVLHNEEANVAHFITPLLKFIDNKTFNQLLIQSSMGSTHLKFDLKPRDLLVATMRADNLSVFKFIISIFGSGIINQKTKEKLLGQLPGHDQFREYFAEIDIIQPSRSLSLRPH